MRIGIGCDHGGYEMKEELKRRLTAAGHTVADKGIYSVHEVDYPDVAVVVAKGVVADEYDCAILVCGTGIGMSIAANKVRRTTSFPRMWKTATDGLCSLPMETASTFMYRRFPTPCR